MSTDRETLHHSLLEAISAGDVDFEERALEVFRFQFTHNAPYRAYAERLGRTLESVHDWTAIPAVPTEVYKAGLHLACFPPEGTIRTFLTSGTSGETRGRHSFRDLSLYEAAVRSGWEQAGLPKLANAFFTALPPEQTPASSLAHMFATLCPDKDPGRWLMQPDGRVEAAALRSAKHPVVLLGTTLSLLQLCATSEPIQLPAGSHVFHTGGFKGVRSETDPLAAMERIATHFGIGETQLIHEYGMTELSSQSYARGTDNLFHCPTWLRVRVIDPASGETVAPGGTGYLVLYDLANLDSVMTVRTRDFAIARDDSSFQLLGRDPGALPRGCSRASDALFQNAP